MFSTPLVINWHVTEACNYRCQFCYAHWTKLDASELWRNGDDTRDLIAQLAKFGERQDLHGFGTDSGRIRLNIAGGEPTLWHQPLHTVLRKARDHGMGTGIISNGSRPETLVAIAPLLDLLGLSVDSVDDVSNSLIGRADRRGNLITRENLLETIGKIRNEALDLPIKINTVVNSKNVEEDFTDFIRDAKPARWKILRVLPKVNDELVVTDEDFLRFIDRHSTFRNIQSIEDNTDMERSYLMIDPHGRFFQNVPGEKGYTYSEPIIKIGFEAAFEQISFSEDKFRKRYVPSGI